MKSVSDYYHESQLACTKKVVIAGFIALILFAVLIIISQYEITEKSSFYLKKRKYNGFDLVQPALRSYVISFNRKRKFEEIKIRGGNFRPAVLKSELFHFF